MLAILNQAKRWTEECVHPTEYLTNMSVWTRDDWKDFLWALKTIKVIKANIK